MLEAKIRRTEKNKTQIKLLYKSEDEPTGLNLRSFSCTDWSWNLTEDHSYFVIGYSDTYVMSDCCIVNHVIMEHGDPVKMEESLMSMLNRHTPEEFAKRLYAYCKDTLKADSNTAATEQPKITYSLSRFGPDKDKQTWLFYRPTTKDWTTQYMDNGVYKTDNFNKFLAFVDSLEMSILEYNLYMAKHTQNIGVNQMLGASGSIEHVMLRDLFKRFFEVPKFR